LKNCNSIPAAAWDQRHGLHRADPGPGKDPGDFPDRQGRGRAVQTGTGKTAAFLITIFQRQKAVAAAWRKALIIAPTRELAVQIEAEARLISRHLNLRTGCFYGGVGYNRQEAALKKGWTSWSAPRAACSTWNRKGR